LFKDQKYRLIAWFRRDIKAVIKGTQKEKKGKKLNSLRKKTRGMYAFYTWHDSNHLRKFRLVQIQVAMYTHST